MAGLDSVRALEKAGFHIARQGKHIIMTEGVRILTIPNVGRCSDLMRFTVTCR